MKPLVGGLLILLLWPVAPGRAELDAAGPFATAIAAAEPRVVKIYGGQIGRVKGYGSGVLVSADGQVVTVLSSLLESDVPRVVLWDGRRLPAIVIGRDRVRQLALLKIDALDLPHFELGGSQHLRPGDWIIAAANPFKVADGPEPVSFSAGLYGGRTSLQARRRTQELPYSGEVLLTDMIVSAPGAAGGALVDVTGGLVGLIGKEVISERTNTWLNYALPVEEVAAFVANPNPAQSPTPVTAAERLDLGIRLFDVGGRVRPAYVERVRPGSPAAAADVRADDLILSVGGRNIGSCADYDDALRGLRPGPVELVVKRGDDVLTLFLEPQRSNR
jgi:S1-C subfamily serine protease